MTTRHAKIIDGSEFRSPNGGGYDAARGAHGAGFQRTKRQASTG
jgi:hypothetical protein